MACLNVLDRTHTIAKDIKKSDLLEDPYLAVIAKLLQKPMKDGKLKHFHSFRPLKKPFP